MIGTTLIVMSLLLGATSACRRQSTQHERDLEPNAGSDGSSSSQSSTKASKEEPPPDAPPSGRIPSQEEREACLGPPLSPSTEQLPTLEGLRHVVLEKEHIFLPLRSGGDRLDSDGPEAVAERVKHKLGNQTVYGLGSCGSDPAHRAFRCMHLTVAICEPWLGEVRRLAAVLEVEGLGIVVEISGRTGPRCKATDASCESLPYHQAIADASQEDRNWAGQFTLPLRADIPVHTLLDNFSTGSCAHSGDCVRAGCGNHCDAWYRPVFASRCPGFPELVDAYCGCVDGQCSWFTQTETAKLSAEVKVTGWQGDIPRQPPPQPKTANELFEQRLSDDWMLRQMRRLSPRRTLPRRIEFSFSWHPKTRATDLILKADGQPAPAWLFTIFQHLPLPQPDLRSFRAVRVTGTLDIQEAVKAGFDSP